MFTQVSGLPQRWWGPSCCQYSSKTRPVQQQTRTLTFSSKGLPPACAALRWSLSGSASLGSPTRAPGRLHQRLRCSAWEMFSTDSWGLRCICSGKTSNTLSSAQAEWPLPPRIASASEIWPWKSHLGWQPQLDRPPGRLRYKARGHITLHAATGEAPMTQREMPWEAGVRALPSKFTSDPVDLVESHLNDSPTRRVPLPANPEPSAVAMCPSRTWSG